MNGLLYDAGALIGADRGDRALWRLHTRTLTRDLSLVVPDLVLAQAWRGGPQPLLSRFLRGCTAVGFDTRWARRVGAALAASGTSDVVDAAVVVQAEAVGLDVVTTDPGDLARVAAGLGRMLEPVAEVAGPVVVCRFVG
jgi:hypothetical protein